MEHRFPGAYTRRLEEAEEDGETAPATGMLDLPVAFIACNTPTARPAPDTGGAEHVFPPGFPIDLVFYEPRYLALIDRVMATTARRFAVQPTPTAAMGAVVRAESARRTPDGRVHVKAAVECRYRVLSRGERQDRLSAAVDPAAARASSSPPAPAAPAASPRATQAPPAEEGAAGDECPSPLAASAGTGHATAAVETGLAVDEVEGMGGLCLVWCEPIHDKEDAPPRATPAAGSGGGADGSAGARSSTSSRLARFAARLVAQAGDAALPINAHFGQPPLRPGPLSFYLCALLDLSAEERRHAMETLLLQERQQLLLAFLQRIAAQSAEAAVAPSGAPKAETRTGGDALEAGGGELRRRADRRAGGEAIAEEADAAAAGADPAPVAGGLAGAPEAAGAVSGTAAAVQRQAAAVATPAEESDLLDRVEAGKALWMLTRTRLGRKSTLLGGFSQAQGPLAALTTLLLLVAVLLLAGNRAAWEANHGDLA